MDVVLSALGGVVVGLGLGWFLCGRLARYRGKKIVVLKEKLTESYCSYDGVWLANASLRNEIAKLEQRLKKVS
jgi:hypothetical protein